MFLNKMHRLAVCFFGLAALLGLAALSRAATYTAGRSPRTQVQVITPSVTVTRAPLADDFTSAFFSEILAVNEHGLQDEDGNYSGWIEINNGGRRTINFNGWFLTDTPTNLTKWRFPRAGLLSEKFLVIYASGKNRTNDPLHLHTNFRLNPQGGYLALVNADTNIVSVLKSYPAQTADVSYGAVRGEPSIHGLFNKPTPGKHNASSGKGFAPEVIISQPGGTFSGTFKLVLFTTPSGGTIRFTLDGTLPTSKSLTYTGPLTIGSSMQVRARAFQDGLLPGPLSSETYICLQSNAQAFTSTLPIIVLDNFGRYQYTSAKSSFVHLSVYEPVDGKTSLTNKPTLSTRAGFHVRGSSTGGMQKSSYAIEFLDEFNEEQNRGILGLPADSDWVLYAPNEYEPIMIHNPFIHELAREMGYWSPRTRFVEVFVMSSSGSVGTMHYNGIYVLEEKIKIAKNRINIDRLGAEDVKPPDVTGGYLFKCDRLGPGEVGFWAAGRTMVYVEPKEQVLLLPQRTAQRQYLTRYLNEFQNVLSGPDWKDPEKGYRAYVDVDSWIDFHVLEVLSGNVDTLYLSTFVYKPRDGKLTFGPHWDFDRSLGSNDRRDAIPRKWTTGPFFTGNDWWARLLSDPDFWQLWVDRWEQARTAQFSLTNLCRLIDNYTGELREAQPREVQRWGLFPRGGSYDAEIEHMKDWLSNRVDFIDRQLTPQPGLQVKLNSDGSSSLVTLSGRTNTTIYYTLNGVDPRLPQGGISSNAVIYSEPIRLSKNESLFARGHDPTRVQYGGPLVTTPWSAPVKTKLETK
jgi:hypothetical protein